MNKTVHYFSFYVDEGRETKREAIDSSTKKIEYIRQSILQTGNNLVLISTALGKPNSGFLRKKQIDIDMYEKHIYLPTFGFKGRIFNLLRIIYLWFQIAKYILLYVKSEDTVIIYHSLIYIRPLKLIRKIKKFKLILECNDIYYVTMKELFKWKREELDFIESADAYIFINNLIENKYNKDKPYALCYGNYELPKKNNNLFLNEKVNVVYAGVIENLRQAAILAAKSALFLDDSYIVHILGFGDKENIASFIKVVEQVNNEKGYEAVVYHGKLSGQKYSDFLHSCQIGLSCHAYLKEDMDSADFTFPSKIPTYIGHDLHVVSPDISCVFESPFAKYITFYRYHKPEAIAEAIVECRNKIEKKNSENPSMLIDEMDKKFLREINSLL